MARVTTIPDSVTNAGQLKDYTGMGPVPFVLVNAPLDSEYRNIARDRGVVDSFIAQEVSAGRAFTDSVDRWNPYSDLLAEIPIGAASKFNYARFQLPNGDYWYSFVSASYKNLTVSAFAVKTDAWTTFNLRLGSSHVVRGHYAVAASQNDTYGDQWLTEPEPIAVGDMEQVAEGTLNVFGGGINVVAVSTTSLDTDIPFVDHQHGVYKYEQLNMRNLMAQQAQGDDEVGQFSTYVSGATPGGDWPSSAVPKNYRGGFDITENGFPEQPLTYPWTREINGERFMMIPNTTHARVSRVNGSPVGGGLYVYHSLEAWAQHAAVLAHIPWVARGIQQVFVVPAGSYGEPGAPAFESPVSLGLKNYADTVALVSAASILPAYKADVDIQSEGASTLVGNFRSSLISGQWRKLATSQFASVLLNDLKGTTATISPERVRSNDLGVSYTRSVYGPGSGMGWLNGVAGMREQPMPISWHATPPSLVSGPADSIGSGASSFAARWGMRVWGWFASLFNNGFKRYGSQAKDGFNTTINQWMNKQVGG